MPTTIDPIKSIGIQAPAVNSLDALFKPQTQTTVATQQAGTQGQGKFFSALNNLMPLIQTGAQTATQISTNKANQEIARKQAEAAAWQAQASLAQQGITPYAQPKSNNTWLIVGGVAIVAIILVVVLMKKQ